MLALVGPVGSRCIPLASSPRVASRWLRSLPALAPVGSRCLSVMLSIAGGAGDGDNTGDGRGHGEKDPGGIGDGDQRLIIITLMKNNNPPTHRWSRVLM